MNLFISSAYAQAAGAPQGPNPMFQILMLLFLFVFFYFIAIRPQRKETKRA